MGASNTLARAIALAPELRRLAITFATLARGLGMAPAQIAKRAELLSATIAKRLGRLRDCPLPVPFEIADHVVGSCYDRRDPR